MELLPGKQKDFSSKEYWKTFFEQRSEAFEWYGNYRDLQALVRRALGSSNAQVLVVGCGNSSFSADLYDDGFPHVTNVDFEERVIADMSRQHIRRRPLMRWRVMDMTDMRALPDASFDAIIDKGAIDALMSEDTPAAAAAAARMLAEARRLLRPRGRHVVVTLAQPFIARALLRGLRGWALDLHAAPALLRPSPYLPFCVIAQQPEGGALPQAEVSEAAALAAAVATARFDEAGAAAEEGEGQLLVGADEVLAHMESAQAAHRRGYDLSALKPGRFEEEHLWSRPGGSSSAAAAAPVTPRYTLLIVDAAAAAAARGGGGGGAPPLPCAVVLVPRGREHEFAFSALEGLQALAEQAGARRLIAVRCNRGHAFTDVDAVRAELTPALAAFVTADCRGPGAAAVPIMAVDPNAGLGRPPRVAEEGTLACSGAYAVEEVEDEDSDVPAVFRRLIFMASQGVIQTEIRLTRGAAPAAAAAADGGAGSGAKGKKRKGGKKGRRKGGGKAPPPQASEVEVGEENGASGGDDALRIDPTYFCFDYHRCMVAGAALSPLLGAAAAAAAAAVAPTAPPPPPRALVIGLGGGALPLALRRFYPQLDVTVCELDPEVADLARRWFGFEAGPQLRVVIADGLDYARTCLARMQSAATSGAGGDAAAGATAATNGQAHISAPPAEAAAVAAVTDPGAAVTALNGTAAADAPLNGHGEHTGAAPQPQSDGGSDGSDARPFAAIFIDVDSKDPSVGMSCPPAAFVDPAFLAVLRGLLAEGGVLAINVAARSATLRTAVLDAAAAVFCGSGADAGGSDGAGSSNSAAGVLDGEVHQLRPSEEDVNTIVLAVRGRSARGSSSSSGGGGARVAAAAAAAAAPPPMLKAALAASSVSASEVAAMAEMVVAMERVRVSGAGAGTVSDGQSKGRRRGKR
ncbi:hypothetical protein JKP88DRAFT_270097 [Tribonema minus]|uniref:Methyltransferase type 11 domain-containing protein n=1 Tax=Tribonema minus TaxID=303371 RepID=A0A836CEF7_9STRA|nr:hypothetical protein JKP88DRAFT_270097 [Tribonema minus]